MYVGSGKRLRDLDRVKEHEMRGKSKRHKYPDPPHNRGTCDIVSAGDSQRVKRPSNRKRGGVSRYKGKRRYSPRNHPLGWIAGLFLGIH